MAYFITFKRPTIQPLKKQNKKFGRRSKSDMTSYYQNCHPPVSVVTDSTFNIRSHAIKVVLRLRRNEVRNITSRLLGVVCKDMRTEPSLLEFAGKHSTSKHHQRSPIGRKRYWVLVPWSKGNSKCLWP